jgi:hypothetical protein
MITQTCLPPDDGHFYDEEYGDDMALGHEEWRLSGRAGRS